MYYFYLKFALVPLVHSTADNLIPKILTHTRTQKIISDALPNPFLTDSLPPAGDLEISCENQNPFILPTNVAGTEPMTSSKVDWLRFE